MGQAVVGSRHPRSQLARYLVLALGAILLNACQSAAPPVVTSPAASASSASAAVQPTAPAPSPTPPPATKLTSAYAVFGANSLPLFVAKEAGFFEQEGLDVELVNLVTGTRIVAAVMSGEAPIGYGGDVAAARVAGSDIVMLMSIIPRWTYQLLAQPSIGSLQELRGKRLGVTNVVGVAAQAARYAVRSVGLTPGEDVTLQVSGGHPDRLAAMLSGELDAGLLELPHSTIGLKSGLRLLLDFRDVDYPVASNPVTASRAWIDQHEDVTRRYVRAIVEAIHFLKTRKADTLEIMQRVFNTDDLPVLEELYEQVARLVPEVPYPTAEALRNQIDVEVDENPGVRSVRLEDMYDDRFLRELEASGFVRQLYGR
jgi:NitT/TauT family transport system substrate-binding protein